MASIPPVNYGALQSQIDLSGLQNGFNMREANRVRQAEVETHRQTRQLATSKFEYDKAQDAEYKADVENYIKNGKTPEDLFKLQVRWPEKGERVAKAKDGYTMSQQQDMIKTGWSAIAALSANKPDLAKQELRNRVKALANAGIDTTQTQAAIDMIDAGKTTEARNYLSFAMGGLTGIEHASSVLKTLGVGAEAENVARDDARAEAQFEETKRHNRASEGVAGGRLALSQAAGARAERKANQPKGGGKKGGKGGYSNADLDALLN